MRSFKYIITDEVGIHARPAGMLVKEAKNFKSKITLECNGKSVEITKLMALMALGIKQGAEVIITAQGEDEEIAISKLEEFFKTNL